MSKMNPEVKEKWLNALESGEYKQTRNCLKDEKGFCCLGVLSDLYLKTTIGDDIEWRNSYTNASEMLMPNYDDYDLPPYVMEWAGLTSSNPKVLVTKYDFTQEDNLSVFNDDHKMTFKEIADVIREQL